MHQQIIERIIGEQNGRELFVRGAEPVHLERIHESDLRDEPELLLESPQRIFAVHDRIMDLFLCRCDIRLGVTANRRRDGDAPDERTEGFGILQTLASV